MHRQTGFTLLEVLVALAVLSVGLLGLASLQITALRYNASSLYLGQAINLAYQIIDSMRANRALAVAGNYTSAIPTTATVCATTASTLTGTVAAQDLQIWRNAIACTLPSGEGSITLAGNRVTVTVQWDDSRAREHNQESVQPFIMATDL